MRHTGQAGPVHFLALCRHGIRFLYAGTVLRESQRDRSAGDRPGGLAGDRAEQGRWQLDDGVLTGRVAPVATSAGSDARAGSAPGWWRQWTSTATLCCPWVPILAGRRWRRLSPVSMRGDPSHAGIEVRFSTTRRASGAIFSRTSLPAVLCDIQAPSCGRAAGPAVAADGDQVPRSAHRRGSERKAGHRHRCDVIPYLYERHPGLTRRSGYIGLLVESGVIEFRNILIESLE